MKSKKIIALIVAFAAFMAVATSGLAAVTTTTSYYTTEGKVDVNVTATADAGSEVTYLVKSNDQIVYIDQQTATDGKVSFNYKIAQEKIKDLATTVDFGTNGVNAVDETGSEIVLENVSVTAANATVKYYSDKDCTKEIKNAVVGTEDTVYAVVTPADGYHITDSTKGEVVAAGMTIELVKGDNVVVTLEETVKTPVIEDFDKVVGSDAFVAGDVEIEKEETGTIGDDGKTYAAKTSIIKVAGKPSVVGVKYNNNEYPALGLDEKIPAEYDEATLYAVRIIVEGVQVGNIEIYYR